MHCARRGTKGCIAMDGLISCAIVRLTRDPEKRYTQAGKALLNLNGVVVDAKAEEGKDTWLKVTVFGDKAESLADQVQKGAECYVEGRLKLAKWQSREGAERSGLELLAWRVDPPRPDRPSGPAAPAAPAQQHRGERGGGLGRCPVLISPSSRSPHRCVAPTRRSGSGSSASAASGSARSCLTAGSSCSTRVAPSSATSRRSCVAVMRSGALSNPTTLRQRRRDPFKRKPGRTWSVTDRRLPLSDMLYLSMVHAKICGR